MTDYTHKRKHYHIKTIHRMGSFNGRMILITSTELKKMHERYQRKYGRPNSQR